MLKTAGMESGKTENKAIVSAYRTTYQQKMSELDHFKARMNMPIGSSSISFPITEDVRKEIDTYAKEIRQRIKENKH
jgi:thymidine kinase